LPASTGYPGSGRPTPLPARTCRHRQGHPGKGRPTPLPARTCRLQQGTPARSAQPRCRPGLAGFNREPRLGQPNTVAGQDLPASTGHLGSVSPTPLPARICRHRQGHPGSGRPTPLPARTCWHRQGHPGSGRPTPLPARTSRHRQGHPGSSRPAPLPSRTCRIRSGAPGTSLILRVCTPCPRRPSSRPPPGTE
jgi:hypothetical protein